MKKSIKAIVAAASAAVVCAAPTAAAFTGIASVSVPGITASAADNKADVVIAKGHEVAILNNIVYEFNTSTKEASIAGIWNYRTIVSTPATVIIKGKEYKVTEVRERAFKNQTVIKEVDLSGATYLRKIGTEAFAGTISAKIKLNTNLETIDNDAFYDTNASEITIPGGVKTIGNRAFKNCYYLKRVFFQSAVVAGLDKNTPLTIKSEAFAGNARLTHIDAYRSVYAMESGAFRDTNNITWYEGAGRNSFASQYKK